jgi:hypothetical protein
VLYPPYSSDVALLLFVSDRMAPSQRPPQPVEALGMGTQWRMMTT